MAKLKQFRQQVERYSTIAVDSSIFIYQFEQHAHFEPLCSMIFDAVSNNTIQLVSSAIVVSEVMVQPIQQGDTEVVTLYDGVFATLPNFTLIEVDYTVAKLAAYLRAQYTVLLPDAIHVACALRGKADVFMTNDQKLKSIRELPIICLKDFI